MLIYAFLFIVSFGTTYLISPWIKPKLEKAGFIGLDVNKKDKPEVAEMGGFVIVFGFTAGILLSIFIYSFSSQFDLFFVGNLMELRLELVLASLSTIYIMTIVGIFDDLLSMRPSVKTLLPIFAALPLVAVQAGVTTMRFPFLGAVDLGIIYPLVFIPIGITGASNVTNMLAGFNGLEAGMGFVAVSSLAFIAYSIGSPEALVILLSMGGALLAFLLYNGYPAKLFMGDIGTLSIGTVIASAVIVGNYETAGVIVTIPYIIDFFIKLVNGFPSDRWWGEYVDGKLKCNAKPISLCQWIMKLTGGLTEIHLVTLLVGIEAVFGVIAIALMG